MEASSKACTLKAGGPCQTETCLNVFALIMFVLSTDIVIHLLNSKCGQFVIKSEYLKEIRKVV